ncbi:16727_t:CDS:2, partial [Gigaspora rosea]
PNIMTTNVYRKSRQLPQLTDNKEEELLLAEDYMKILDDLHHDS